MYIENHNICNSETTYLLKIFCSIEPILIKKGFSKKPSLELRRSVVLALVRRYFNEKHNIPLKDALFINIQHYPSGAPYLVYPDMMKAIEMMHISISHTGPWVAFVLSSSNCPVSIDIENVIKPRSLNEISKSILSKAELSYVKRHGDLGFYYLWGTKESLAKFYKKDLSFALKINLENQLNHPVDHPIPMPLSKIHSLKEDGHNSKVESIIYYQGKKFLVNHTLHNSILMTTLYPWALLHKCYFE